jgi:hypothetical protein
MPDHGDRAILLRQHLESAGVKRAELFTSDAQRKHITFHDLRATGITWAAVRGDDPLRIKQRAGHSGFSTTEIYIREAENLGEGFGEVFPQLPQELTGRRLGQGLGPVGVLPADFPANLVEQRGIEHPPPYAPGVVDRHINDADRATQDDAKRPEVSASRLPETDVVEAALAEAIKRATSAERWDVVSQLARELEARRIARAGNVVMLGSSRAKRSP